MEPYLFHGIRDYNIEKLISILKCGYILPRKMLPDKFKEKPENPSGLNGESWISLSQNSLFDDDDDDIEYSSFDRHILDHMCIVIKPFVPGCQITNFVPYDLYGPKYIRNLVNDDSDVRYSIFTDEVQTKEPIAKDDFLAIGYPKTYYKRQGKSNSEILDEIEYIKNTRDESELLIPIVDSSFSYFADNARKIKKYTITR